MKIIKFNDTTVLNYLSAEPSIINGENALIIGFTDIDGDTLRKKFFDEFACKKIEFWDKENLLGTYLNFTELRNMNTAFENHKELIYLTIFESSTIADKVFEINENLKKLQMQVDDEKDFESLNLEEFKIYYCKKINQKIKKDFIFDGIDMETDNGLEHFSMTIEDQLNLDNAFFRACITKAPVLYRADKKDFRLFTLNEIVTLYTCKETCIFYYRSLMKALKEWISRCSSKEDVLKILPSSSLPEDIALTFENSLKNGTKLTETFISKISNFPIDEKKDTLLNNNTVMQQSTDK